MRLVTWNMARGPRPTGLDADPWAVLASLEPDIALLQECRRPKDGTIAGHLHHIPTRRGWGTAIWSRWPLHCASDLPASCGSAAADVRGLLAGYVASAEVETAAGQRLAVVSVHAYPALVPEASLGTLDQGRLRTANASGVWPTDLVWWGTRELAGAGHLVLMGGDWNASLLLDSIYGPRGNREFFARMEATGWFAALRKSSPEEVQTYFRKDRGPYQLDHVFVTRDVYDRIRLARVEAEEHRLGRKRPRDTHHRGGCVRTST